MTKPVPRGSLTSVSRRAGVSVATASRVLNGSTHPVSARTRERVLAAAGELGYSRSALARALVTRRSQIVGVIVGDVVDPYFAEITRGVEDVAGRAGYLTIVCNADRRPEVERDYLEVLREYNAAGAIFGGSGLVDSADDEALAVAVTQAHDQGMHVISLAPRSLKGACVCIDNRAASYDVCDYVVSLGHQRVSFVSGPPLLRTADDRLQGYRAALADRGLEPEAIYDGDFTYESGQAAVLRVLAEPRLPHAIVAANDEAAIGVVTALRQAGIGVPEAVSVVGIGDTRPARFLELTTVSIPTYELGAIAARRVLAGGEPEDQASSTLPHRLVPRATTARRVRAQ